jgi:hypothetical protein
MNDLDKAQFFGGWIILGSSLVLILFGQRGLATYGGLAIGAGVLAFVMLRYRKNRR